MQKKKTMRRERKWPYRIFSLEEVLAAGVEFEAEDEGTLAVVAGYLAAGSLQVHGRLVVDACIGVLVVKGSSQS